MKILFKLFTNSYKDVDVVVISYMCQIVVPFIKHKFKNKIIIVDFFISLYDSLVFDRKKIKDGSFMAKMLHKLDEKSIKAADLIIVDTKEHGKYFEKEFFADICRQQVLYLEADSDIYYPRNVEKPSEYRDKFLVLYFGTVIPLQGFDIVLQTIEMFKDNKDIHFIIIGPLNKKYKKVELDIVTYYDWLEQKELAHFIAMADLCLAGHFNGEIMKAQRTIPGKAYIYEAMGKRMVLGDSAANHERYSYQDENVSFVRMGDSKALYDVIDDEMKKRRID